MNIRRLIAISGFGRLLLLLSCLVLSFIFGLPLPDPSERGHEPETPEEAARLAACESGGDTLKFKVLEFNVRETQRYGDNLVILYDALCATEVGRGRPVPRFRFASVAMVEREVDRSLHIGGRTVWEDRFWSAHTSPLQEPSWSEEWPPPAWRGPFISYDVMGAWGWSKGIGNYEYVNGSVLEPGKVAAVEAVLGNGSTVRGDITRGVWVLFALESGGIREVRALDRDGRVLERLDLELDM